MAILIKVDFKAIDLKIAFLGHKCKQIHLDKQILTRSLTELFKGCSAVQRVIIY